MDQEGEKMPYYDFYCEKCGHRFEEYFGVNDDRSGLKCPECESKKVQRNFGSVSIGVSKGQDSGCSTCSDTSACGICSNG